MEKIEQIKPERKMKHTPTLYELKKLFKVFDAAGFHETRLLRRYYIDRGLGMRGGECLALLPERLNIPYRSSFVSNQKNKQERYVYFSL